jgi:uncharacterized small protein (DUF1192 family)
MTDIVERLRAPSNWLAQGRGRGWKDAINTYDRAPFEAATEITRLTAEVERLMAVALDAEKESKYSYFESHIDRVGDENRTLRAEIERLRAALKLAHKYVLVQSFDLSLMPRDAKIDLVVIEDALAMKEKQG